MHRVGRQYMRQIEKDLPLQGPLRRRFLMEMKSEINAFTSEKASVTVPLLIERFGDADSIAKRAYDSLTYEELQRMVKKGRNILGIVSVTCAILVIGFFISVFITVQQNMNKHYDVIITSGTQSAKDMIDDLKDIGWTDEQIVDYLLISDGE